MEANEEVKSKEGLLTSKNLNKCCFVIALMISLYILASGIIPPPNTEVIVFGILMGLYTTAVILFVVLLIFRRIEGQE